MNKLKTWCEDFVNDLGYCKIGQGATGWDKHYFDVVDTAVEDLYKKLTVKKIWSLSPNKYKTISIFEAIKGYEKYCLHTASRSKNFCYLKTFNEWLKTEI